MTKRENTEKAQKNIDNSVSNKSLKRIRKMPEGTLEVRLVSAKGLKDTDFLSSMDPYCILTCGTQERKSTVALGQGSKPVWNETFLFTVYKGVMSLNIRIMDKDTYTDDDFVGEARIYLRILFEEGSIPPISYNVVKNKYYCGEIRVGLKFTRKTKGRAFWKTTLVDGKNRLKIRFEIPSC